MWVLWSLTAGHWHDHNTVGVGHHQRSRPAPLYRWSCILQGGCGDDDELSELLVSVMLVSELQEHFHFHFTKFGKVTQAVGNKRVMSINPYIIGDNGRGHGKDILIINED